MIAVTLGTRRLRALERGAMITPEEQAELVRLARLGQQFAASGAGPDTPARGVLATQPHRGNDPDAARH